MTDSPVSMTDMAHYSEKSEQWRLKKAEILGQLSPEQVQQLHRHSTRLTKCRGDALWLESDVDLKTHVYIVDQGFLRVCELNDEGKRFIVSLMGPGDFFGSITPNPPEDLTDEYMEVVRDARIIAIEAPIFHQVISQHPDMVMRLANVLVQRQATFKKRMTSMLFKDVSARIAELLLDFEEEYGEVSLKASQQRVINLTHQEMADLIGAARPVVSSVVSDLVKLGLLGKQGRHLFIANHPEMLRVADLGSKALFQT